MRTFRLIGMALLAVVMCFTSCSKDDDIIPAKSPIEDFNQLDMNFTEKAAEQTFSFTANSDWTVNVVSTGGENAWCMASPTQGSAGNQTIKITTTENDTYDDRSVTVTLKSGSESKSFVVTQKQKNAIILGQKEISVKAEGETIEVKLSANVDYKVEMPDVDWITTANLRSLMEHTLYYEVAKNLGEDSRSAKITFTNKDSGLKEVLTVTQEGELRIVTIDIPTAGKLSKITKRRDFKSLKLTGYLNGADINTIREMKYYLEYLDISGTHIVAGKDKYYVHNYYGGLEGYNTEDNEIGTYMFYKCDALKQILLPNGITLISYGAFYNCRNLTNVNIPNSVTKIGDCAFEGCTSLTNVNIPNSVTVIGGSAFQGCESLTNVNIPNSVTEIGGTFFGCTSLKNINIPNSVTVIGGNAFRDCESLTNVNIPNSVTKIEYCAFLNCKNLTSIDIPNSVTEIGGSAFQGCANLTIVKIGTGLKSIYETGLLNSGSIKEVYCFATTPPESSSRCDFGGINKSNTKLYIPKGTYQAYYLTDWGICFDNIIEMEN